MTPRNRLASLLLASAAVGLVVPRLQAAQLYWQGGGAGALISANYFNDDDDTSNQTPGTNQDFVRIGSGVANAVTHSSGTAGFNRLQVGLAGFSAPYNGAGLVTVNNGAKINLVLGGSGNPSLRVGETQNGTLNIDGPGSSVTASSTVWIGYAAANQVGRSGTINVTNGGSLIVSAGNIRLGEGTDGTTPNVDRGMQGHLNVSGTGSTVTGAVLHIGLYTATSSFTQSNGTVTFSGAVEVGTNNTAAVNSNPNNNSSFNISNGTFSNGGNFFVGRGKTTNATVNITGGTMTVGGAYLMGGQTGSGVVTDHSGGTLKTTGNLIVGDASPNDSTYKLRNTGVIDVSSAGIAWVGRQGTANFFQTGGTADFKGQLQVGNWAGGGTAPNALYKISAGGLNVGTNVSIATVAGGTGELRVVGDNANIGVGGDFTLGGAAATLAFELEAAELLSAINVSGIATFNAGSKLIFDATNALPTQYVYDLLTAASIVDNNIDFIAPAGWTYQIVSGNGGQILQAVYPIPEPATLLLALMAGVVALRCRRPF